MTVVRWGLGLTALVTVLMVLIWGRVAILPGVVFGVVATLIQVAALRALKQGWRGDTAALFKSFGVGLGLRLLGVVVLGAAIGLFRPQFPPVPSAIGFLGVLVPLLFLEVKLVR